MIKKHKLVWVDKFIKNIKPYVYMRLEDNVLIRMPNEAFKLNTTAARVIHHILKGGSVMDFVKARGDSAATMDELERFFIDFSLMWNDEICDNYSTSAVNRTEFSLDYIKLPVLSELAITYTCNIKCKFCYAGCTDTNSLKHLDMDSFKKILDKIRYEAQVPSVSFTGGEPTVNKDLPDLVRYAAKVNKMRVNLITNGTLITKELAKKLARAGLSSAQVSIESPFPHIHEAITGISGSHGASLRGLKALAKEKIIVHPHFTINRLNVESLISFPKFCRENGIERFSGNILIPAGRGDDEELKVSYSEIGKIVMDIKAAAEEENIRFMWYSPTPVCLFNPITAGFGNRGCSACEGLLSIDPLGNVLPCSSWSEPVGNILEESFETIWNNRRSVFIRAKKSAPKECQDCRDFALCQGACPLYFNVHGCGELEKPWQDLGLLKKGALVNG